MTWYNFGAIILMLAMLAGIAGANDLAMYLALVSVGCVLLDLVAG